MYHVPKSSVSLQLLSDVFGDICFYVSVYVFWLGEEEPTKKKLHILHKGLFMCSLKSRCALGDALFVNTRIHAGSIFFTHMSMERRGSCRDEPAKK